MTPSLFDLPLRLGDCVSLASLVYEFAEGRTLNDEIRNRIAGRAALAGFQALSPLMGSLERDPIHPSAYYVCADGVDGQPMLIRIATAQTPGSGLFPKAILIGRTHLGNRELVISAVPFGPDNRLPITTFSTELNKAFQPKTFGTKPVIRVRSHSPATQFGPAADGFRAILKATGQNKACFAAVPETDVESFYFHTMWAVIRAGWREGYAIQGEPQSVADSRASKEFTRVAVRTAEWLPAMRESRKRSFDVELITAEEEAESSLEALKEAGWSAQSLRLAEPPKNMEALEALAQRFRTQLNLQDIILPENGDRQSIVDAVSGIQAA